MDMFRTKTFNVLQNALDASMLRHRTIANNIANVDTPGYKSQEVSFEEHLTATLGKGSYTLKGRVTDPRHLPIGSQSAPSHIKPTLVTRNNTWVQNNGNNVDVEYEMTRLAQNQMWYDALIQQTNGHFMKIREVIREGR